jgi:prophage regulatory protein
MIITLQKNIKLPEVIGVTGKSRSSIYAGIREGSFPPPLKIGRRAVAWSTESIRNWQESCATSTNNGAPAV